MCDVNSANGNSFESIKLINNNHYNKVSKINKLFIRCWSLIEK